MAESMSHWVKATKEEIIPFFEDLHKQGFGFQDLKYKAPLWNICPMLRQPLKSTWTKSYIYIYYRTGSYFEVLKIKIIYLWKQAQHHGVRLRIYQYPVFDSSQKLMLSKKL